MGGIDISWIRICYAYKSLTEAERLLRLALAFGLVCIVVDIVLGGGDIQSA